MQYQVGIQIPATMGEGDYPKDYKMLARYLGYKGHSVSILRVRPKANLPTMNTVCLGNDTMIHETTIVPPYLHSENLPFGLGTASFVNLLREWISKNDIILTVGWWNGTAHIINRLALKMEKPTLHAPLASLNPLALRKESKQRFLKYSAIQLLRIYYCKRKPHLLLFDQAEKSWLSRLSLDNWRCSIASLGIDGNYPEVKSETFSWNDVLGMKTEGRRILFFNARLNLWHKGYDFLIEGMKRAAERRGGKLKTLLVISGKRAKGKKAGEINIAEKMAKPLVDKNLAVWKGFLPIELRTWMLQSCDMFVYPSRIDGPPRPIREALWRGTPLMVTHGTGYGMWVHDYTAGISIPESSAEGVCSAILRLEDASDADMADFRNGAVKLRERLLWKSCVHDYLNAIEIARHHNWVSTR